MTLIYLPRQIEVRKDSLSKLAQEIVVKNLSVIIDAFLNRKIKQKTQEI